MQAIQPTPEQIKKGITSKKLITVLITFHDIPPGKRVQDGPIIEPTEITVACTINNLENKIDATLNQAGICFNNLKGDILRVISEAADG